MTLGTCVCDGSAGVAAVTSKLFIRMIGIAELAFGATEKGVTRLADNGWGKPSSI